MFLSAIIVIASSCNHIYYAPKSCTAFETALVVRAGGKDVKFQCGLSFSNFTASSAFYLKDLIETLNASIGISINIKPNKK